MTVARWGQQLTATLLFGAVVILFAFYGTYFVRTLVPLPTELAALALSERGLFSSQSAYAMVLAAWSQLAGEGLVAARTLSLLATVASITLVFRLGRRLMGDPISAAWATLIFVLFPPLVATLVCATPHALAVLLSLAALDLLLASATQPSRVALLYGGLAGVLVSFGVMMVPLGAVLMPLWLLFCAALTRQHQAVAAALILSVVVAGLMLALNITAPEIDVDLAQSGHDSVFKALVLPYAMVPVAVLLGALCLLSRQLRDDVGSPRALAVLCAPIAVMALAWVAVATGAIGVGQLVTAMGYGTAFAIFASWPLIVWVRRIMPQVKSIWAWIAFPVIMYSCFWVILGPIDPGKFPYSHRQVVQPSPPVQR
jgi:4-amino-4-deoxy-L-arabinose transferase-like glycosyltransferase